MYLSIDPRKVAKQLENNSPAYVVTPYNLDPEPVEYELPTADICSVTLAMPPELERARERVLALRQQIVDRGVAPLSAADIERQR